MGERGGERKGRVAGWGGVTHYLGYWTNSCLRQHGHEEVASSLLSLNFLT